MSIYIARDENWKYYLTSDLENMLWAVKIHTKYDAYCIIADRIIDDFNDIYPEIDFGNIIILLSQLKVVSIPLIKENTSDYRGEKILANDVQEMIQSTLFYLKLKNLPAFMLN